MVSCWQYHSSRQMTWEGSSSAIQAIEYVCASAASVVWVPHWPQPYTQVWEVSSKSNQIYSSCESQGRGWNDNPHLQEMARRKSPACLLRCTLQPQTGYSQRNGELGSMAHAKGEPSWLLGFWGDRPRSALLLQTIVMGSSTAGVSESQGSALVYLMSTQLSPQRQRKALETPCCPPQAVNTFPGMSCSSMALTPHRSWLHQEPKLIL